ncbi:unnamed protein product (macronuclear) [Paramecium tetraurelia]|uniref:Replication factor C subunit 1 n=1 Tax=Paramecium tetraurelia TaxID=5888 RepID=A0BP76_PARTE|nr:uncharacterized protein GSPATT00005092001 [Paramecium tetraurelia]CAK60343.1 unnamed protein product [Paramecium tetraurelia]|eukprot:XP_001427741.1 hypothetical protein (macronuclear) [Paramecium tetraurelia strain d4-2]
MQVQTQQPQTQLQKQNPQLDNGNDIIQQLKKVGVEKNNKNIKDLGPDIKQSYDIQFEQLPQSQKKKGAVQITWEKQNSLKVSKPENKKQMDVEIEKQDVFKNDPDLLNGLTIVLSGILNVCSRDKFEQFLKNNGAKVTGSVSGKTNYLIVGDKLEDGRKGEEGNKFKEATKKGTKIIRENELNNWLVDKIGVGIDEIFPDSSLSKLLKKSGSKKQDQQETVQSDQNRNFSLADKYMPMSLSELVDNKSSITQLNDWIYKFQHPNSEGDQNQKIKKKIYPIKNGQILNLLEILSCLISGPPGIGKTSMVRLVAEALGLKLIVNNASDKRNKGSLRSVLNDLIDNSVLMNLFRPNKDFLIVMDEVDGMTGSDRGGISALIECIKSTRVPIVCICNDIDNPKLKSLLSHCYSIKFQKPEAKSVAKRLKYICEQENINMSFEDLEKLAICFDCDIRQSINMLELQKFQSNTNLFQPDGFKKDKVCVFNTFNAAVSLLNRNQRIQMSLRDMLDMFFLDYDLIPLIIQDNYILSNHQDINNVAKAAELIAEGDIISKKIRKEQQWSLMPSFGFLSSVYPSTIVGEQMDFPKFPSWLGKNSTANKIKRERHQIKNRLAPITYLTSDIKLYSKYLFQLIKQLLELKVLRNDRDAVWNVVQIMEEYRITPDLLKEDLHDQIFNPLKDNLLSTVNAQIKTQLTKMYNKRHLIQKEKTSKKKQANPERYISENYNPLIGEEAPLVEQSQKEIEEEENKKEEKKEEEMAQGTKSKNVNKRTKKQSKKETKKLKLVEDRSFDEDSQQSLNNFIVDDEEDE